MIFRNYEFFAWQYLTGQISMRDFKEAVALEDSMLSISFDYAQTEEKTMPVFREGNKVRLKDSPYAGVVEPMHAGWDFVRFRTPDGTQITVSDASLLEHDIDPKPGDVYEDNAGHEWVITRQRWRADNFLSARCVEDFGYEHSTLALDKPENVAAWTEKYEPRLVRRR